MIKRLSLVPILILLAPALLFPANRNLMHKLTPPLILTGLEDMPANLQIAHPPYKGTPLRGFDLIGDTITVGQTWWETQHNSQIGRMIVKDDSGYIHIVWTNGLDEASNFRHVYYNYITPEGLLPDPDGIQVDNLQRGGFATLAVDDSGRAFPAFHQRLSETANNHSAVAYDYLPHLGAFSTLELPWLNGEDRQLIWPRIARKPNGEMLILSRENGTSTQTWSWGTYDEISFTITYTDQIETEPSSSISNEVAASRISNRVGAAYTATAFPGMGYNSGSDIHAMVDDDGLNLNFDNWWNVSNFLPPDLSFLPDTLLANADTLRAWADCNIFFDMEDICHITFTTISWFTLEGGLSYYNASCIWHWSEAYPNDYQMVARAWEPENTVRCGNWNFRCQRPLLGQNEETGYLYCMYQQYDVDTSHISAAGYPSGEVYISVSTDGGFSWSVGTNVTNTITPGGAQAGECASEFYPSMAEKVDGYCHLVYVFDYDAGQGDPPANEGMITLNPIKYHRVPVSEIALTPVMPYYPFHVEHVVNPTGVRAEVPIPKSFGLEQNAPNPFNPTTVIRFSLDNLSNVTLAVYNLRGERVTTLAHGAYQAGTHTMAFDGAGLASGIYIYRLEASGRKMERKMVLLK